MTYWHSFKVGDKVVGFEYKRKNKWAVPERFETFGEVVAIKDDWVFVDSCFGAVPFKAEDVEYEDAPF